MRSAIRKQVTTFLTSLTIQLAVVVAVAWPSMALAQSEEDAQQAADSAVARLRACMQEHGNDWAAARTCSSDLVRSVHPEAGPAGSILGVQETTGERMKEITNPVSANEMMNQDVHTAPAPDPTPTESGTPEPQPSNAPSSEPTPTSTDEPPHL